MPVAFNPEHIAVEPHVATFSSASSIPKYVWDAFAASPQASNIMYPHALSILAKERAGMTVPNQLWIACTSSGRVDFVLSCTSSKMGQYPVFIFSSHPIPERLTYSFLFPRMVLLAQALAEAVSFERVYSVFAPTLVSVAFCNIWSNMTGVPYNPRPEGPEYYAAMLSYCTRESFTAKTRHRRESVAADNATYELRPAVESDIAEAAELCYGFASESEPFTLTRSEALKEASLMVAAKQLWVHRIKSPNRPTSEIASIVAVTRSSDAVSAITKVYTNPAWRKRGCAERLVRRVVQHILFGNTHGRNTQSVVLYCAHDNLAAATVYDRVGFAGIAPGRAEAVRGVDPWLELGFDPAVVKLGHW